MKEPTHSFDRESSRVRRVVPLIYGFSRHAQFQLVAGDQVALKSVESELPRLLCKRGSERSAQLRQACAIAHRKGRHEFLVVSIPTSIEEATSGRVGLVVSLVVISPKDLPIGILLHLLECIEQSLIPLLGRTRGTAAPNFDSLARVLQSGMPNQLLEEIDRVIHGIGETYTRLGRSGRALRRDPLCLGTRPNSQLQALLMTAVDGLRRARRPQTAFQVSMSLTESLSGDVDSYMLLPGGSLIMSVAERID